MRPYYSDETVTIYHSDCRDVLPTLDPCDTCITDPPYGLAFMGKAWDHAVPDEAYWRAVMDAVKPGAMLLAFGGTRLWHWLAVGIEQAGWEIRDTVMWMYGSGFPKSLDVSKAIDKAAGVEFEAEPASGVGFMRPDGRGGYNVTKNQLSRVGESTEAAKLWDGWGSALKPAYEPVILAMRPLSGTFAENALEHGVAGLNVDGGRIEHGGDIASADSAGSGAGYSAHNKPGRKYGKGLGGIVAPAHPSGRWPANVILDEEAAAALDDATVERIHGAGHATDSAARGSGMFFADGQGGAAHRFGDEGGASRFFYTAKASRSERGEFNTHPTVKPLDLLQYLCKLTATPTGGVVLDPFMGSGSTLIAANRMGRKAIGIELSEEYCEIAARRIQSENLDLFASGDAA